MLKKINLPIITIILGTIFQLLFVFLPDFRFLIVNTLPDDAFYYFNTARHILAGHGSTFDGVNLHNGYHPLWMLLILPMFKIFSVGGTYDIAPIYASLVLSIFFSTYTAIIIYKILQKYSENIYLNSFVLFTWMFNPYVIYSQLNGLETSLTLFFLTLFSYLLVSMSEKESLSKTEAVKIGLVSGLLFLSRLDMSIVVFFGLLYLLYKFNLKNNFNNLAITGLITGIIFAIWQIYNLQYFKIWLTTASITGTYTNHFLTYNDNGGSGIFLHLKTAVYMFDRALIQLIETLGASYIFLGLTGIALFYYFKNEKLLDNFRNKKINPLIFVGVGLVALMFVSASLRWLWRTWYYIPQILIFTSLLFYALKNLESEFKTRFNLFLLILTILVSGFYYISWEKDLQNREIMQDSILKAAIWQNENLPDGTRIGSFNSGIQGYFSRHYLVNLDGLVNENSSKYIFAHEIWKYINEVERLDFISDFPQYITYKFNKFFGPDIDGSYVLTKLEIVNSVGEGRGSLNTYRIIK